MRKIIRTPELEEKLCEAIEKHGSIASAEKAKELPVCREILRAWRREDEEFAKRVEKAQLKGVHDLLDTVVQIAQDCEKDIKRIKKNGDKVIDFMSIRRAEVLINTIFRLQDRLHEPSDHIPQFCEIKTPVERLRYIAESVAHGRLSSKRADILARITGMEFEFQEVLSLKERVKLLEEKEGAL